MDPSGREYNTPPPTCLPCHETTETVMQWKGNEWGLFETKWFTYLQSFQIILVHLIRATGIWPCDALETKFYPKSDKKNIIHIK